MKKIISLFSMLLMVMTLSSCLESGLDELPLYENAEITNVKFEYRYVGKLVESDQLVVTQMKVNKTIDIENATITVDITVPSIGKTLPESEREKVSLSNLVCYFDLSTAAVVTTSDIALGKPADFSSKTAHYTIKAANGTTKEWTLVINSFTK